MQRKHERAQQTRTHQEKQLKQLKLQLNQAQGAAKTHAKPARRDGDKLGFNARGQRRQKGKARVVGQLESQTSMLQGSLQSVPMPRQTSKITLWTSILLQKIWIRGEAISQKPLLHNLSFSLSSGDRLAITGDNGAGKTTLLNIIRGLSSPDEGQIIMSENARLGFLDQEQREINLALSAQELLLQANPQLTLEEQFSLLNKFGIYHNHDRQRPLKQLSIGQCRKAQLAAIVASGANILLLDEPTNHIDLLSLEQIEAALLDFPGIVIAVSHDRFFLKKLPTSLLTIKAARSKIG